MKNNFCNSMKALMIMLLIATAQNAIAQAKVDNATVTVGSTTTITLPLTYRNTLNKSTSIVHEWSTSDNSISITSQTRDKVIIKGNSANTSAKVYYRCSYNIDGFYRTMDFYWDVTVKSNIVYVTRINLNPTSTTLVEGENLHIYATCYPTNATDKSVSWTTSNASIASVDTYGNVTAVSAGEAVITCRSKQVNNVYSTCNITVTAKEPEEPEEAVSEKTIVIKPYNADPLKLSFTDEPTVTIAKGIVSATHGNTSIEYTYGEIESITFEEAETSNVESSNTDIQRIRFDGEHLCIQGYTSGEQIHIYTEDGINVITSDLNSQGITTIHIGSLPQGVYIVSIMNSSIKIYRE